MISSDHLRTCLVPVRLARTKAARTALEPLLASTHATRNLVTLTTTLVEGSLQPQRLSVTNPAAKLQPHHCKPCKTPTALLCNTVLHIHQVMMQAASAVPAARGINRRCCCVGAPNTSSRPTQYDVTGQECCTGSHAGNTNSYAAQQHFAEGREIKLRDARGTHFEPHTSYAEHYPPKVNRSRLPCCCPQAKHVRHAPAVNNSARASVNSALPCHASLRSWGLLMRAVPT